MVCLDGGLFANNPALFGLVEAQKYWGWRKKYMIVSLGTGSLIQNIDKKQVDKFNTLTWAKNIFSYCSDGQSDTTEYQIKRLNDVIGYFRFQLQLTPEESAMDNVSSSNLNNLIQKTKEYIHGEWKSDLQNLISLLTSE